MFIILSNKSIKMSGKKEKKNLDNILNFTYASKKFLYKIQNSKIYFRCKDVIEYLGYTDVDSIIKKHLDKEDIIDVDDKYMTKSGLYELFSINGKKEASNLRNYIKKNILHKKISNEINVNDESVFKNITIDDIIFNTDSIISFYNENDVYKFLNSNVFYFGVVGMHNGEYIIKYGISGRIYGREYDEHKKIFGEQFKIFFVIETDNNANIEKLFEQTVRTKNLYREMIFRKKNRTELFLTSKLFTIDKAIETVINMVKENPTSEVKNKNEKIKCLEMENKKICENMELQKIKIESETKIELEKIKIEQEKIKLEYEKIQLEKLKLKYNFTDKICDKPTENPIDDNDIYYKFLDECTEESYNNIKTTILYEKFSQWHLNNYANKRLPSNREFNSGIKKHKTIEKVCYCGISVHGIKKLKLKN